MTHQLAIALERGELGVDQAEAHVLAYLSESGEATVTDIHRTFGHKRSTLTSVLDRLQAKELVERVVNEADRRSFIIRLTANGRVIGRNVQNYMRRLEREIEDQLSDSEMAGMEAVARAIGKLTATRAS
ncbi:MAG TPA: MarR family transcriptional regulator [Longimicrobiales bacterium]